MHRYIAREAGEEGEDASLETGLRGGGHFYLSRYAHMPFSFIFDMQLDTARSPCLWPVHRPCDEDFGNGIPLWNYRIRIKSHVLFDEDSGYGIPLWNYRIRIKSHALLCILVLSLARPVAQAENLFIYDWDAYWRPLH